MHIFKIILFLDLNNSFFPDHSPFCWWFSQVVFLTEPISFYVWTILQHKPKAVEMQPYFTFVGRTNPWRVVIIVQLWSMFHLTNVAMVRTFFTQWLFLQLIDRNLITFTWRRQWYFKIAGSFCIADVHITNHGCHSFSPQ